MSQPRLPFGNPQTVPASANAPAGRLQDFVAILAVRRQHPAARPH